MRRQLTAPEPGVQTPITDRIADSLRYRLTRRPRTYPVVVRTVTAPGYELDNIAANPNTRSMTRRQFAGTDPATGVDLWLTRVTIIDRAHPHPTRWQHRTTKARRALHRIATRAAVTVAKAAAIITPTVGGAALAWWAWGDYIAAGLRLIVAAVAAILSVTVIVAVGSWWTSHGRNGCPGLHCTGCDGGH